MKTKLSRFILIFATVISIAGVYAPPALAVVPTDPTNGASQSNSNDNCFGGTSSGTSSSSKAGDQSSDQCVAACPTDANGKVIDCTHDPVFAKCNFNSDNQVGKNNTKALGDCLAQNNIVKSYLNPFIKLLSFVVGLAVTVGIIIGGIQYASSAGDPQKAAVGKKHIRNALLALVIYALLFAILQFLIPGGVLAT